MTANCQQYESEAANARAALAQTEEHRQQLETEVQSLGSEPRAVVLEKRVLGALSKVNGLEGQVSTLIGEKLSLEARCKMLEQQLEEVAAASAAAQAR